MSALAVHATQVIVHTEPGLVHLDLSDEPGIFMLRLAATPGQVEKIAAELLMAAERARRTVPERDFKVIA
jgi:hypothetical protein